MSAFDWSTKLPTLRGRRTVLRWLEAADAPALFEIFADADVTQYWSSGPMPDPAAAAALVREIHQLFARRELFEWGVCTQDSDEIVGTCTLYQLNTTHRRAELGIALNRRVWGRGLASDALRTMIGFAFEQLELHRLEADIDPGNERSLKLFEKQGFRREGYLRERWHVHGKVHDAVFLGLLRGEWPR